MNILIGSCGGLTGMYLSKILRSLEVLNGTKTKIFGFDVTSQIATRFFLDKLIILPPSNREKDFIEHLINTLNNYSIDIYIPVHSQECRVVSKYQNEILNQSKAKFMISPYDTFLMLDDKMEAYKALSKMGISTPKIYSSIEQIDNFPVVVKPRLGSGSKGLTLCYNIDELNLKKEQNRDVIFVEYINGVEYTTDAFFDFNSNLVTYNQRIRIKTLGGAAVITKNDFKVDVKDYIEKIGSKYKIIGPSNFQFFLKDNGEIVFTDINLRFASGGLPLSVESGANIVELLILELKGKKYDPKKYQSDKKPRVMYRYFEERFELESDHI